jgi:hypothetical protein
MTTGALLVGSMSSLLVSGAFMSRAARAATRAIWWHNATFAR